MEKTKRDMINVAIVNFRVVTGDKAANLKKIVEISETAAKRGAEMVLFPEMCLTGCDYFVRDGIGHSERLEMAETIPGPAVNTVAEVSKRCGVYIVFGMPEKKAGNDDAIYNSAVVCGPQGYVGAYQKIHPYGEENIWVTKGEDPYVFETEWGTIGLGICYDTYQFPELLRYYVYKGARLYLNPTAVIEEAPNEGAREAFIRCYTPHLEYGVLANSIYIATSNLTGRDGKYYFAGGSTILGPKTNIFDEVDSTCYCGDDRDYQAGVHIATLDLTLAVRHLCINNPFSGTPDFRPEIYKKFYV